jgi:hypothetical protein
VRDTSASEVYLTRFIYRVFAAVDAPGNLHQGVFPTCVHLYKEFYQRIFISHFVVLCASPLIRTLNQKVMIARTMPGDMLVFSSSCVILLYARPTFGNFNALDIGCLEFVS